MPKKPPPTFTIFFRGRGVYPEEIPWRKLTDALDAVHKLATLDGDSDQREGGFRLIGITRGSAGLQCYARDSKQAIQNLKRTGRMLESRHLPDDAVDRLRPLDELSRIARSLCCTIRIDSATKDVLATIEPESYADLVGTLLVSGETTLTGRVERVGGATDLRCALRVPDLRTLLYCDVAGEEIARELGKQLYQDVVVTGTAQWLKASWQVARFRITSVAERRRNPLDDAFRALRRAGGDAWDNVDDPNALLRELRG